MTVRSGPQVLTRQDLKGYFVGGCKKPADLAVGVEWEKVGIYRENGQAIQYSGTRGVKTIFEILIRENGWEAVLSSDGQPIALKKGSASVTLEPGGQIELSGQKAKNITENTAELLAHLHEIKKVSDPLGIAWLGIGAQPFSVAKDIEWVPKDRYAIMRRLLADKGALTYSMMKETASVQISVDYLSETDAMEKLRLALVLSPVLCAIFGNSPIEHGSKSPFLSRRAHIWRQTTPERSGLIEGLLRDGADFDDYIDYALSVPLIFLQRNDRWHAVEGMNFGEFMERGWNGLSATAADWELHLSSIFTEARLKKYIEVRSIDCQTTPRGVAAVAFIKGLLYNDHSRKKAWELIGRWDLKERRRLMEEAYRTALKTKAPGGGTLQEIALRLLDLSREGLEAAEKHFLFPIEILTQAGLTPAQEILSCVGNFEDPKDVLRQVIRCCEVRASSS